MAEKNEINAILNSVEVVLEVELSLARSLFYVIFKFPVFSAHVFIKKLHLLRSSLFW